MCLRSWLPHDREAVRAGPEQVEDGARVGAAVDEVADADDEVVGADGREVEEVEELGVAAVDVADN
jgi:hypothetical protein